MAQVVWLAQFDAVRQIDAPAERRECDECNRRSKRGTLWHRLAGLRSSTSCVRQTRRGRSAQSSATGVADAARALSAASATGTTRVTIRWMPGLYGRRTWRLRDRASDRRAVGRATSAKRNERQERDERSATRAKLELVGQHPSRGYCGTNWLVCAAGADDGFDTARQTDTPWEARARLELVRHITRAEYCGISWLVSSTRNATMTTRPPSTSARKRNDDGSAATCRVDTPWAELRA